MNKHCKTRKTHKTCKTQTRKYKKRGGEHTSSQYWLDAVELVNASLNENNESYSLSLTMSLSELLKEKVDNHEIYNIDLLLINAKNECTQKWVKEALDGLTNSVNKFKNKKDKNTQEMIEMLKAPKYAMIAILLADGFLNINTDWFNSTFNNFKTKLWVVGTPEVTCVDSIPSFANSPT